MRPPPDNREHHMNTTARPAEVAVPHDLSLIGLGPSRMTNWTNMSEYNITQLS